MKMKSGLLIFAAWAVSGCGAGQTLSLTPDNAKIAWTLTDPLHTVRGTFKLKSGSITFDTDSGKASGSVIVDVKSGESGNSTRDSRMHANVLESAKYPEAVFTPDRVEGKLPALKIHGMFRIHGADHEITMNAQTKSIAGQLETDISFGIPYVAWGMKDPSNFLLKVGKTVEMNIHVGPAALKN
jgi:polyisoprenoid-binding protein YceI